MGFFTFFTFRNTADEVVCNRTSKLQNVLYESRLLCKTLNTYYVEYFDYNNNNVRLDPIFFMSHLE